MLRVGRLRQTGRRCQHKTEQSPAKLCGRVFGSLLTPPDFLLGRPVWIFWEKKGSHVDFPRA